KWHQDRSNTELSHYSSWQAKLADSAGLYHLSPDWPRPARRVGNGATARFRLNEELGKKLTSLSHRHRMTVFMTMLAAFQCLLHVHSGDEDIGVGTCAANRPLSKI